MKKSLAMSLAMNYNPFIPPKKFHEGTIFFILNYASSVYHFASGSLTECKK